jgi:hypothetical protein
MNTDKDEASIPTENERKGGRMSVRRKFANMLTYFNPFSTMPAAAARRRYPRREKATAGGIYWCFYCRRCSR